MTFKNFILYSIFFISGFCGLCYEILWCREFNLILGHTTYATAMVLTAFMSGLAAGSYFFGRAADRAKSSLALYAYIELAIAFYAVFFYRLIEVYKNFYIFVHPYISHPASDLAFKLFSSFALIIIPTTLMGATFPVMAKIIIENMEARGRQIGLIYFFNSAGGALGCFICGFYLLYNFGSEFGLNIICALNILCGVLALAVKNYYSPAGEIPAAGGVSPLTAEDGPAKVSAAPADALPIPGSFNYIFIFTLLSGFISMLLEVSWTRFLILIIGSSTYSFSMMLSVFIFFLAAGSLAVSYFVDRLGDPMLAFALCEFFIGLYILATLPFYEKLPLLFINLNNSIGVSYYIYMSLNLIFCLIVMAVPALLFGASFPLAAKSVEMNYSNNASEIGKLYSYNTIGCILGSFLAGIVILPSAGFKNSIELAIAIAFLIFIWASSLPRRIKSSIAMISARGVNIMRAVAVILIAALFFLPAWDHKVLNIGSFYRTRGLNEAAITQLANYNKVLYYKESISATVYVIEDTRNGLKYLKINGKTDGSTMRYDMLTQSFLALLPLAKVKSAKNILIIGLGTGATLAAACKFKEAEKITCVEIIPEVIQAAKHFDESYDAYKNDPRVSIVVNDARSFLLTARDRFDVIISEPSNPWISGISSLFTTDFFSLCRSRLSKEGVMLAWIQAYESSPPVFKLALRTFRSVFNDASLWFNANYDVFALGSADGACGSIDEPFAYYQKLQSLPALKAFLDASGIKDPLTFSSLRLMTSPQLKKYVGDGILNSDNFQMIEYEAPVNLYSEERVALDYRTYADNLGDAIEYCRRSTDETRLNEMMRNAALFLGHDFVEPRTIISLAGLIISNNAADEKIYHLKAVSCARIKSFDSAIEAITKAIDKKPADETYLKLRAGWSLLLAANGVSKGVSALLESARADYEKAAALNPVDAEAWRGLITAARISRDGNYLVQTAKKAFEINKTDGLTLLDLAAEKLLEFNEYSAAAELYDFAFARSTTPHEKAFIKARIEECAYLKTGENEPR
ncbi:MAG: Spermidine synthase [bacterium ADurb.Bin243]|nr:MAG: Spermidine synthase [bacterium ADurb.Bin243]